MYSAVSAKFRKILERVVDETGLAVNLAPRQQSYVTRYGIASYLADTGSKGITIHYDDNSGDADFGVLQQVARKQRFRSSSLTQVNI